MAVIVLARAPSILLTTLDTVKAEMSITDTSQDDVLYGMLKRASSAIARYCNRSFGVQQYQETLKGSGSQILGLFGAPLLSVTQVLMDTEVVDPSDRDQGYWIEDTEAGALYRPCGWGQTVSQLSWGSIAYSSMYILPGGTTSLRYTVTYTAGYFLPIQQLPTFDDLVRGEDALYDPLAGVTLDTAVPPTVSNVPPVLNRPAALQDAPPLPGDVEQACLDTVKAWWFLRARDPSIKSTKTEDLDDTYDTAAVQSSQSSFLPSGAIAKLRDYRKVIG